MTSGAGDGTRALVAGLDTAGVLPASYRPAFEAVDRADFIPARMWCGGNETTDADDLAVDRGTDPQGWTKAVYDPRMPIVTQFDDGAVTWPDVGYRPTSSASAPTVVAGMLRVLGPQPGDRLFEVGTGTGYNAALLAEIVGHNGAVTTVEIDQHVAAQARERLDVPTPANVTVLTGDGATVVPAAGSRWDRVIATVGVPLGRLPYAWVEHTRPGGVIVAPIFADFSAHPLVRLVVGEDGIARGHADADLTVGFMHLRDQRPGSAALHEVRWDDPDADVKHTTKDLWDPLHDPSWCWAAAVATPSCRWNSYPAGTRSPRRLILFADPISRSWASIHADEAGDDLTVRQAGPRRLADEVYAAITWYARRGAPPLETWLWEVGPSHQSVTLPGSRDVTG
ncbi:methyltransferase domain-containing protein [Amycolatopsis sp. NPDC059021]|uniref:methyltransferase domain-containing protein n=1 Tax=Amycolatopsis sp. NPDC059021 TaxID=3346704 RepID=UPI00366DBF25